MKLTEIRGEIEMNNLLMQLTNDFKNLFVTEDNEITPLLLTLLSGGLGAVITLIFTYFMTLARDKKQNKEQNRTYIIADEIDNLGARLEGYTNIENKELRIIETDNFIQLDNLVQKGHIHGESLNYLRLRNLGPAMLVQCDIQITIGSDGREDVEINKVIPLFLSNQELFVFAQSLKNVDNPQLLKKVVIQYKTVANEGVTNHLRSFFDDDKKYRKHRTVYW